MPDMITVKALRRFANHNAGEKFGMTPADYERAVRQKPPLVESIEAEQVRFQLEAQAAEVAEREEQQAVDKIDAATRVASEALANEERAKATAARVEAELGDAKKSAKAAEKAVKAMGKKLDEAEERAAKLEDADKRAAEADVKVAAADERTAAAEARVAEIEPRLLELEAAAAPDPKEPQNREDKPKSKRG